ncbi:MAG: phosphoribosylaminoimidazolesuccinocarboxamide synthase [Deltaproteobacteria bacterium]|nr:phosphoribosylaminoimidazolesuccinocarboxamide synthase [Deltaproteobacteria bacterium]
MPYTLPAAELHRVRWLDRKTEEESYVGIDIKLLEDLCAKTLDRTDLEGLGERHEGKVRDSYVDGDQRTIVVTDRVSSFDVVIGTIPLKGQVLNGAAAFWFDKIDGIIDHHLIDVPDPNVSRVRNCQLLPVEFVYRGYLTGSTSTSIWTAYSRGDRSYCGHSLRDGMQRHEKLSEPLLTPTTKADFGQHDELTSREELISLGAISEEQYDRAAEIAAKLFRIGTEYAESRGMILVDTKYEMGLGPDGEIIVIDEIHTPDSSRYWYLDDYERALSDGRSPAALDKEYVRLWLGEQGYKGDGPPPTLPIDVRCEAARRYIEAFERISGTAFEANLEEPIERMKHNLGLA